MSRSIDQRIVEMQFDNAQFERGIEQSVNSLNNLDKTIDNIGKSSTNTVMDKLSGLFQGIDAKFGGTAAALTNSMSTQLVSAANQIEYRFSALQVAMVQVISNITNQLYSFVNNAVGKVTDKIVQGGINRAMNIENAHFMLQGLIDDENEVQAIMQDAKDSVDGTAYAYDSAAKAASQFAATGMRAGEKMQTALKGITGIAATTNSSYEDISRVFTTVAGNGRLMGDQLLQLSSRGLNVAASLSKYFQDVSSGSVKASDEVSKSIKKLVKKYGSNEAAIRDMVSKGKISFDIFSEAMGTTFGEHAKKANETFNGALSNIGAALARTGEMFVAPMIEQNGVLVKLFNAIRVKVNEVNAALKPLAKIVTDRAKEIIDDLTDRVENINLDTITQKLQRIWDVAKIVWSGFKNIFSGILTVTRPMVLAFKELWNTWGYGVSDLKDLAKSFVDLTYKMRLTTEQQEKVRNATKEVITGVKNAARVIKSKLTELKPVFANILQGLKIAIIAIAQIVKEVWNWVKSLKGINITFGGSAAKVKEWLNNMEKAVVEGQIISKAFEKIRGAFERTFNGFGEKLSYIWENIKSFFGKFKDSVKTGLGKISFSGLLNGLAELAGGIAMFFANSVIPNLPKFGEMLINGIHRIGEELNNFIKSAGYRDIKAFIESFVVLGFFNSLRRFFEGFGQFNKSIFSGVDKWTLIGGKINDVLYSSSVAIDKFAAATQAKVIKEIGVALALLAGSLFVLSLIDPDSLAAPFAILSAFIMELAIAIKYLMSSSYSVSVDPVTGFLGSLSAGFDKIYKAFVKVGGIVATITAIGFAILTLSAALAVLSKCDPWMLAEALVAISVVMWEIFGLIAAMKAAKLGAVAIAAADAFKQFAIAFGIIALSLKLLSTLQPEQLVMGMTGLTSAILLMVVPMKAFYEMSKNATSFTMAIKAIKQMSVALALLAGVIWLFGSMDILKLAQGLGGVTIVCTGLVLLFKELGKATKYNGLLAVKSFTTMAASLILIAVAIKMVGDLPLDHMAVSLIGIGGLIAALVIASKSLDGIGASGAAGFLGLAVGLVFIASAIKKIGDLSVGTIVKSVITLGVAVAGLVIAANLLGAAAGPVALFGAALLALGVGVAAIGAGIWLVGAGFLMLEAAVMGLIGVITGGANLIVVGIVTLIKGIAQGIYESADVICLAVIGIVDAVCNAILNTLPTIVETILILIEKLLEGLVEHGPKIISLLLDFLILLINGVAEKTPALIQAIMNLLGKIWQGLKEAIAAADQGSIFKAIALITGVTAILTILGAIPGAGMMAIHGLQVMAIVLAGVIALMMTVGVISSLPGVNWLIHKGGDLLEELGLALGRFIGGLIGGVGLGVSNQFPKICENIQNGLDNLSIDTDTVEGIKSLAEAMLLITADNLLESITRFFTGKNSFEEFGKAIESFGPHFANFYDSIKGIDDTEKVKNVCEAIKILCEAANQIPDSGESLKSFFFGDHDIGEFGRKLVSFGPHFVEFCDIVKNIDTKGVEPTAEALKAMCVAAKQIPDRGESLKSFFFGDHDISEFGRKLVSFGPHFKDFCSSVVGIDTSGVQAAADALKIISVAVTNIPGNGEDLKSFILGNHDISEFGRKLASFGGSFKQFVDSVAGTGADNVTAAANCFQIMVTAARELAGNYTFFEKWGSGEHSDFATFGKQLAAFAPYFAEFVSKLGNFDSAKVSSVVDIVKKFSDMAVTLNNIKGGLGMDLTILGVQLEEIGTSLNSFAVIVSEIETERVDAAVETLRTLVRIARDIASVDAGRIDQFVTSMASMGTNGVQGIIDAMRVSESTVPEAIQNAVDEYVKEIETQITRVDTLIENNVRNGLQQWTFKNIAKENVLGGLLAGLKDSGQLNSIKVASGNAGKIASNNTKNSMSKSTGRNIGVDFINGLIIGLNSNASRNALGRAATFAGTTILTYIRNSLDSHSPSREAIKIGGDVDTGLAIGIDQFSNVVATSAKNVGDTTLNSMRDSIDRINENLMSDDFRPVISPVLDLSDVSAKAGDINGMFSDKQFKMATEINGMMNSYAEANRLAKSINLDDGRMVEAITGLRKDVNTMGMQMGNLQVVMDSGALVGQIASPMDNALGSRALRNWREREA